MASLELEHAKEQLLQEVKDFSDMTISGLTGSFYLLVGGLIFILFLYLFYYKHKN